MKTILSLLFSLSVIGCIQPSTPLIKECKFQLKHMGIQDERLCQTDIGRIQVDIHYHKWTSTYLRQHAK